MRHFEDQRRYIGSALEKVAFYGLLVTILLAAVPNGAVNSGSKSLLVSFIVVFAFIRLCEGVITQNFNLADPVLLAPLVGVLFLAVIQILPLTTLAEELNASRYLAGVASFDYYETKTFIIHFTALLLAGEILFRYTDSEKRLLALIGLVLVVGAGSALFGLLRGIYPIGEELVFGAVVSDRARYAQFINRNHFGYLMEMTLGVLIGLLLKARLRNGWKLIFWILLSVTCVATILVNSRGTIISTVGLGLFAVFLYFATKGKSRRKHYRDEKHHRSPAFERAKTILLPIVFSCFLFVISVFTVALIGGDTVASRIESTRDEIQQEDGGRLKRTEIWQSTTELIKNHPVTGVGFGAYGVAVTAYDRSSGRRSLQRAHNEYLEILANGGIVAFVLVLVFLGILFLRIHQRLKSKSRFRKASCFGATIGIFGVLLHNLVDFGLHTTINALIFTCLVVIAARQLPESVFRTDKSIVRRQ